LKGDISCPAPPFSQYFKGILQMLAATGHGIPMRGEDMRRQLETLARDFDKVAKPSHGRYKRDSAVTNDNGVASVPPPVFDPQLPGVLAAAGAVVAIGALLMRGGRR
jgi:hypothetical protein